jgi:hypothetical protein
MIAFATTAEAIAQVPCKNGKVALIAAYLRMLSADDRATAAARFFTGNPFAQCEERTLAVAAGRSSRRHGPLGASATVS